MLGQFFAYRLLRHLLVCLHCHFRHGVTYLLIVTMLMPGWIASPMFACPPSDPSSEPEPGSGETTQHDPPPCDDCTDPLAGPNSNEACLAKVPKPISLFTGAVTESATDLSLPGPLFDWSQTRSYDSRLTNASVTQLGRNWISGSGDARLMEANASDDIILLAGASATRRFIEDSGSYDAPIGTNYTLTHVSTKFELLETVSGNLWIFHDFTQGAKSGRLHERTTRTWKEAGNDGLIYAYDSGGRVTQITTATGQDERIAFFYDPFSWKIQRIEVGPQGNFFEEVQYTYKEESGSYSSDLGDDDDLVQVLQRRKGSDGNWIERYIQYRYFSNGKLKSVFESDAIERLIADNSNITTADNILTRADSYSTGGSGTVASFASRSFTFHASNESTTTYEGLYGGSGFDETGFVSSETVNGSCTSCGGGGGQSGLKMEYHYIRGEHAANYSESDLTTNPTTMGDINIVFHLIVEDVKDSGNTLLKRNIYGLSESGLLLRKATIENPAGSDYWCESNVYRNDRRRLEYRKPSAHVIGGFDAETFLNPYDGTTWDDDLSNDGEIHLFEYSNAGRQTGDRIKKGAGGTAYYVSATDYGNGSDEGEWEVVATYTYPTPTATRASGIQTIYDYAYHDTAPNFNRLESITATKAAVPTAQNGPNASAVTVEVYDEEGRRIWTKDAEGYLHRYAYDAVTGRMTSMIQDAQEDTGSPSRGGSLPTELEITTTMEYDDQGRLIKTTDPGGTSHYTIYKSDRTIHFPAWTGSTSLLPVEVTVVNDAGQVIDQYALDPSLITISTGSSKPTGISAEDQADRVRWTHSEYDSHGRLDEVRRYHLIPTSTAGSQITNYYVTQSIFDDEGQVTKTIEDVSSTRKQETETVYDFLGRVIETRQGVNVSGGGASMVTLQEIEYDGGGIGDSHVTKQTNYFGTGGSDHTGSRFHRTFRGHLRGIEPLDSAGSAVVPVTLFDVDWLGRTTATAQLVSNPTWATLLSGSDGYATQAATATQANRRTLTVTHFDNLGRQYRTEQYRVDQSNGNLGDALRNDTYFDQLDRPVALITYGQAATEMVYDGGGRQYQTRIVKTLEGGASGGGGTFYSSGKFIYRDPQPVPSFSAGSPTAMSGGNDQMIELEHNFLNDMSNPLEAHIFEKNHNDADGLNVAETGGGTRDYVRHSMYFWYDDAHRVTTQADYGSGDTGADWGQWKYASIPAYPGTAPAGSDQTKLVTTFTYDGADRLLTRARKQSASKTVTTKMFYDALDRQRYVVSNYVNFSWTPSTDSVSGTGGGTLLDEDNATSWQYDGLDNIVKFIALDQSADGNTSDNQVTEYKFEDDTNATFNTEIVYPDSTSGTDVVTMEYALDGQLTERTDQRGTELDFTYNDRRQLVDNIATTLGGSTDGSIRLIRREYDALARLETITSYSDTAATTAVNQVLYEFDDFGQIIKSWQEHNGVKDGSTLNVQYTYDYSATSDLITTSGRLETTTYPSGREVDYNYGSGGSFDDVLSHVALIRHAGGGHAMRDLASYLHNGTGRLVEARYESASVSPEVHLSRFDSGTPEEYIYLDRFGRVQSQIWKSTTPTLLAQFDYDHDLAGNRIARDIPGGLVATLDQLYTYDGLDRLATYEEGTIAAGSIASPTKDAEWTLDGLGNWATYEEAVSGSPTLDQDRTHNAANEVTDFTNNTGSAWTDPTHDEAGNVTLAPSPLAPSTSADDQTYIWDAWNRLVEVKEGETTLVTFMYDGLHRRIVKTIAGDDYHYYLSERNQILEEQIDTGTPAVRNEFVWHPYYIDALAARWDNTGESGVYYHPLHDANFNITAVINGSAAVQERYHYTPYGQTTFLDSSFANPAATSSINQENLYTGRQLDPETGLFHYRTRYYDSVMGRFIGRDFIEYQGGMNLYLYCYGSPLIFVDPTGLKPPQGSKPTTGGGTSPIAPEGEGIPGDIEDDYGTGGGMSDCIFGGRGYVNPPDYTPPGEYFPDITSPNELRQKCHSVGDGTCDRLTFGGHGIVDGCGFIAKLAGRNTLLYGIFERDRNKRCKSKDFDLISKCFKSKLKKGGYIRICSCKCNEAVLQDIANATGRMVCGCKTLLYSRNGQYCDCEGKWICKNPKR